MLKQDNLRLRSFRPSDKSNLALLANNKKIWDNLTNKMPHPYEESNATAFIEMATSSEPQTIFAIEWKGSLSGAIGLHPQTDVYSGTAEIGYWVGEPYWGNGIISKAIPLMIEFGFKELNLRRIYAAAFAYNPTSMHVLEKSGFQKEGIFKNAVIKNGKVWDEHRFGLMRP